MKGSDRLGLPIWPLARAILAEALFKAGRHGEGVGGGGNGTWIALTCVAATASLPALVLVKGLAAFLAIQAAVLTLVTIAAAGQVRERGIVSFLSSMPLVPGAAGRVAGRAIVLASAVPAAIVPVLAAITLLAAQIDMTFSFVAVASSSLVSAWPACLSRLLGPALLRPSTGARRNDAQEPTVAIRHGWPTASIGRALLEVAFRDARHTATMLAPAVAAIAVLLAGSAFPASEPVFEFFWLYVLTGFLPFFISSAVAGAGDTLALGFNAVPRFTRRLLAAEQAISGILFLAILAASTAFVASRVADPGQFLLLAASLPLIGWFSCSITLIALGGVGHVVRVGRHFLVLILAFNIFGSMFWNLSMIEPLGPAATTAAMIATGLAGIVLLEALKRVVYRLVG